MKYKTTIDYPVNYYYNLPSIDDNPDNDDTLLHLCEECSEKLSSDVEWASQGDYDQSCEDCGRNNSGPSEFDLEFDTDFSDYAEFMKDTE